MLGRTDLTQESADQAAGGVGHADRQHRQDPVPVGRPGPRVDAEGAGQAATFDRGSPGSASWMIRRPRSGSRRRRTGSGLPASRQDRQGRGGVDVDRRPRTATTSSPCVAGCTAAPRSPSSGIDFNFADAGMGGAFAHALAPMIIQPLINSFFGHGGIMPAQFSPQQGFYDQWRAKQYWQARQAAMATASQADRETYVQMIRGIAQMRGTPVGLGAAAVRQRHGRRHGVHGAVHGPGDARDVRRGCTAPGARRRSWPRSSTAAACTGVDPVTGRTGMTGDVGRASWPPRCTGGSSASMPTWPAGGASPPAGPAPCTTNSRPVA